MIIVSFIKFQQIVFLLILFAPPTLCQVNEVDRYYYRKCSYGSEFIYNPLSNILAGGFGVTNLLNHTNSLDGINFRAGYNEVNNQLANPFSIVKKYGSKNFIKHEVFPTTLKKTTGQFAPNYGLHLIAGGYTFRKYLAWFRSHEYPYPVLNTYIAYFLINYLNEIVENDYETGGSSVDAIADMYIFNPLGALLFSYDKIALFFAKTLQRSVNI